MQIPKTFELSGKTYTVDLVRHVPRKGDMGEIHYATRKVTVATNSNLTDRSFKREEVADTFLHEVTHAILKDMGHRLWNNERFVTQFANRLTEVLTTAKP